MISGITLATSLVSSGLYFRVCMLVAASPELKDCGEVQPASALLFVPSSLVQVSPKLRIA